MAKIFNINIAPTKLYIKPFFLIIPVVVGKSLILTNGVKLIPQRKLLSKSSALLGLRHIPSIPHSHES